MTQKMLTFAEQKDSVLRNVALEAIAAAKYIATDIFVVSILMGTGEHEKAQQLIDAGADKVIIVDTSDNQVEAYVHILEAISQSEAPDFILLGHTSVGRDLAPRLAVQLGSGLISDCIRIEQTSAGETVYTRPIYAGKAFEQKKFTAHPGIITIRANNFSSFITEGRSGEIVENKYTVPSLAVKIAEIVANVQKTVDLAEAKVIVSGGRGVKSAEGFSILHELADVLGGAVGASRGACDADYCDYTLQIGQTGKVVTPDLYIACGISGAIQHLAGMSSSRVIVAINKDPEAPIFQVADYGIVGDLFEVVPMLTSAFRGSER